MMKKFIVIMSLLSGLPLMGSKGDPLIPGGEFVQSAPDADSFVVLEDVDIEQFKDPASSTQQEIAQQLAYSLVGHLKDQDIMPFVRRLSTYLHSLDLAKVKQAPIVLKDKSDHLWRGTFAEFLGMIDIEWYQKDDAVLAQELRHMGCDTKNSLDRVLLLPALIDWVEIQPKNAKKMAGSPLRSGKSQTAPGKLEKPVKSPRKPHPVHAWFAKTAKWWIGGVSVAAATLVAAVVAYHLWPTKKDSKITPANGG